MKQQIGFELLTSVVLETFQMGCRVHDFGQENWHLTQFPSRSPLHCFELSRQDGGRQIGVIVAIRRVRESVDTSDFATRDSAPGIMHQPPCDALANRLDHVDIAAEASLPQRFACVVDQWVALLRNRQSSARFPDGDLELAKWAANNGADLSAAYEQLVATQTAEAIPTRRVRPRKRQGVYYTPKEIIEPLLSAALSGSGNLSPTTVYDPACGTGNFLLATAQRMLDAQMKAKFKANSSNRNDGRLRATICRDRLFGTDIDAGALAIARFRLWLWSGRPDCSLEDCTPGLLRADALALPFGERRFDVTIGNPPFANAIESSIDAQMKARLRLDFPELRGTADLSSYFLALAHRVTQPQGRVGLVLPRAVLASRSCDRLRMTLTTERPPSLLHVPASPFHFRGANVYIAVVALGGAPCLIQTQRKVGGSFDSRTASIATADWWREVVAEKSNVPQNITKQELTTNIGNHFEVFASMTAGMAYELVPFVAEQQSDGQPRLVTTGLIEPGRCEWGVQACRYLKRRFARPVLVAHEKMPSALATRIAKVSRPKVLVAGLSNRVEAFVDAKGDMVGSVGTFTLLSPTDNLADLFQACKQLNSPAATARLHEQLGANALGGGRITLNKHFLRGLPWQATMPARKAA